MAPVATMPLGSGPLDRQDDGIFLFRPDGQDAGFLRDYLKAGDFHVALLAGRLLAPHPVGSLERERGARGDELMWTLEDTGTPWLGDPDTPHLACCRRSELPAKRLGLMPHAELYELPWTIDLLQDAEALQSIARNAVAAYHRSFAASAVYFEADSLDDPLMQVNLRAVEEAQMFSGGRPVCAFVQMPLEASGRRHHGEPGAAVRESASADRGTSRCWLPRRDVHRGRSAGLRRLHTRLARMRACASR